MIKLNKRHVLFGSAALAALALGGASAFAQNLAGLNDPPAFGEAIQDVVQRVCDGRCFRGRQPRVVPCVVLGHLGAGTSLDELHELWHARPHDGSDVPQILVRAHGRIVDASLRPGRR